MTELKTSLKTEMKTSLTYDLLEIARTAMLSHGLEPEFSIEALQELKGITDSSIEKNQNLPDLTKLLWCSIDNDDSMDLDQITVAENHPSGIKIMVGVADVDGAVKLGHAIDQHARINTTSVYTGVKLFPMLPEKLSTNLTSLSEGEDRIALVIEMILNQEGEIEESRVYRATVKNQAKLAYNSVAAWLEGKGPLPENARKVAGMEAQLQIQDQFSQKMRKIRFKHGALELETIEPRAVMKDGTVVDLKHELKNRAKELIEDFMIAANGVTAKFLTRSKYPTLRRVVRSPKRWDRIVQVANDHNERLPEQPDSRALSAFLSRRRIADPLRFPDLSLTVVKLLGRGEYVLEMPGDLPLGHFGLAVSDYSHSTAPNRRFPDLITQRLLKAALEKKAPPYTNKDLSELAAHCTSQENNADKVERQVRKSAAAGFMAPKLGEHFDAIVTGASDKGTWARLLYPPVEGKVVHGQHGLDVGDRLRVKLIEVDVERGFIDFVRVGN